MNKNRAVVITLIISAVFFGMLYGLYSGLSKKVETNSSAILVASGEMISGNMEHNVIESGEEIKEKFMPEKVRAVYSTGWVMGTPSLRESMITSMKENGFNAIVLDIKDESGQLTYDSRVQTAMDVKASKNMVKDITSVINELKENDIYVIGRIVTFKDPIFASKVDSISYKMADGTLWHDSGGRCWPNPYNKESWNYPIALAKEAAELGFQEIQFDYIRFPSSEGRVKNIAFGFESDTKTKADIIAEFLQKVMEEMEEYHIPISADVFGITTKRDGDFENIGQDFARIADIVDVVCPMVYPSHYGYGEYRISRPDKDPYGIIFNSLLDGVKRVDGFYPKETQEVLEVKNESSGEGESGEDYSRNAIIQKLKEHEINIRPYLQDFTASWLGKGNYLVYGTEEVKSQIQAAYDLGIEDFCLWDPSNKYCYDALYKIKTVENAEEPLD